VAKQWTVTTRSKAEEAVEEGETKELRAMKTLKAEKFLPVMLGGNRNQWLYSILGCIGEERNDGTIQHVSVPESNAYRSIPDLSVRTGVPTTWGTFSLSRGIHLRLAIEDKNIFTCCLFSNIYAYIN